MIFLGVEAETASGAYHRVNNDAAAVAAAKSQKLGINSNIYSIYQNRWNLNDEIVEYQKIRNIKKRKTGKI